MNWLSNEMLFYGGIVVVIVSLIVAILYFIVSRISKNHLKTKLDMEYGEKKK